MFDLRYHLASLAAVFVALAVGILLGVAIANKGVISDAKESLEESVRESLIQSLREELDAERARAERDDRRQAAIEDLMDKAYPVLVAGRLEGKNVAVLFLGAIDGGTRSAVGKTLLDAGAGSPTRVTALDLPVDPEALTAVLDGQPTLAASTGGDGMGDLGRALGRELVEGGETPVLSALSSELVEERSGAFSTPVDSVVVMRSWAPEATDDPAKAERIRQTDLLLEGLLQGLEDTGFPVVGIETSTAAESFVDLYRKRGISSVDDVDTVQGRVALALLLAGGDPGHYGIKDSATDGAAPSIGPLPVEAGADSE